MHSQEVARNLAGSAPPRAPVPREPIAIVGMACRLPGGADSLDAYWRLLNEGRDAIQEIPQERWDTHAFYDPVARPGKTQSRWAGLVADIDQFDPQLFGISPREAARMDPQQRLLLEVAWRALEDAGQPLPGLAGRAVSVFVGISSWDYAFAGLDLADRGVIDAYSNTGGSFSIAANRISYCFDLRGPSVAVDTACSSSLVAVHLACESIWHGQAEMALAGGANALLMPDFFVAFSQLGVLSPDGRCKTFDAGANGYVRSEGAGLVVLKPLSTAVRNNDRIYAVIRGTALNQDGRSLGLTVPNREAQQQLVQTACQHAGIHPHEVQYVEAHGTGTPVGDPIEAQALADVLSVGRKPDQSCWIGSVKTNIGHLESGAGIASVIKVALAIHHGRIPAHLHFQSAHPDIDLQRLGLRIPLTSIEWRSAGVLRTAGVNGFGYGGANAHLILQQPPAAPRSTTARTVATNGKSRNSAPRLLVLSARSRTALIRRVREWTEWLDRSGRDHDLESVAATVAHRHSHWEHRLAVCGSHHDEWLAELEGQHQQLNAESHTVDRHAVDPGIVFACCGQGPQWWGMGRELLKHSPIFRDTIEACDAEFLRLGSWSLVDELQRDESHSRLQKTSLAQPALFAIQVALAAVWRSVGISPAAVIGHSVGEIAAGFLAGGLSWQDACCVAFHRGRTMDRVTSSGRMLAVGLSLHEAGPWLRDTDGQVVVSAINGPHSLTLSGAADAIHRLADKFAAQGLFCRQLNVEYAFHSPQMEPVREELMQSLAHITPGAPTTPMYSTVTGRLITDERLDADYWWHNVRQTVRFADSVTRVAQEPWQVFLELGPHPVLSYAINECCGALGKRVWSIASLHREVDDRRAMLLALGQLYELGGRIDWRGLMAQPEKLVRVPGHPFEKQRCWHESRPVRLSRNPSAAHPLVGESLHGPLPAWHGRVDLRIQTYLQEHGVRQLCVLPAAGMLDGGIWVAQQLFESTAVRLENFRLLQPCVLTLDRPKWLQWTYQPQRQELQIYFRDVAEDEWSPLATMQLASAQGDIARPLDDLTHVRADCTAPVDSSGCYDYCRRIGLDYGPSFRGLSRGWRHDGEAVVEVNLPEPLAAEQTGYPMHPALLDSCFHAMVVADRNYERDYSRLYLPSHISDLRFYRPPSDQLLVHARIRSKSERRLLADMDVYTVSGELVLSVRGFESLRMQHQREEAGLENLIYSYGWELEAADTTADAPLPTSGEAVQQQSSSETDQGCHWIIFADQDGLGPSLARHVGATGDTVRLLILRTATGAGVSAETLAPLSAAEMTALLRHELTSFPQARLKIVYLCGMDAPANADLITETLDAAVTGQTLGLLTLVQAWEQVDADRSADVLVVTAGAQCHEDRGEDTSLAQSALIGFGRVLISEYAPWRTRLVDLPRISGAGSESNFAILLCELLRNDDEDEVMWRDGERYVHRFRPHFAKPRSREVAATCAYRLPIDRASSIEHLRYVAQTPPPLAADEVEIEVAAAGLNFSDVMKALGLYPGQREDDEFLGAECAGTIRRLGADVQNWQVGDRVMAVAPGSFGSHVVVPSTLVAGIPRGLSFEQAAGVPIAFLTASHALQECARLRAVSPCSCTPPPEAWAWPHCKSHGRPERRRWPQRAVPKNDSWRLS